MNWKFEIENLIFIIARIKRINLNEESFKLILIMPN